MQATILTLSSLISVLFLLVGLVIGYIAQEYLQEIKINKYHPEMFDENGDLIPDEILAVRFDNDFSDYEEDDDE